MMPESVRFSLFVLTVHLATLLPVDLPGLSAVQAISGFLILSFIPGFLFVSYALDKFTLSGFLYAVGISVAFSMIIGSAANLFYFSFSLETVPFAQPTMSLLYVGASAVLSQVAWTAAEPSETPSFVDRLPNYDIRIVLLLTFVPVFAVIGATLINRYALNELTLLTIICIAIVPVAVYYFDNRGTYYPVAVTSVSLALLLQNTVIMTYLGRGDGLKEYEIADTVLQNGYWVPGAAKDAMPRIGVLQPAYSVVTDINLLWTFKLAHPILFATVPIITYVIASRYFSKDIAFLSATLYIFLPRTYQIISRNTRTGAAIFFTAFLLLAILDTDIPARFRRLLVIIFFWGVITSHYGIGPLVMFALVVAYMLNVMVSIVLEDKRPSQLSLASVSLFGTLIISWYRYLTDGTFYFITSSLYKQISKALFFTEESTAVRSAEVGSTSVKGLFGMPPGSYEVMFIGHLLLGVFTSVGITIVYFRYVSHGIPLSFGIKRWVDENVFPGLSDDVLEDSNYAHLAFGMFLFFPLSFGPNVLSAGRTYALVMVIVAPFPILVLRSIRLKRVGSKPALALLVAFLLVTSGFVSATVTHDVSPQPIIDGERIAESGSTLEQFAYYRVSSSRSTFSATNFMLGHLKDGAQVERTSIGRILPYFYQGDSKAKIELSQINSSTEPSEYTYLSEPDTVTGVNTQRHLGFVFYEYEPLPSYTESDTIYTTGRDKVHYNG